MKNRFLVSFVSIFIGLSYIGCDSLLDPSGASTSKSDGSTRGEFDPNSTEEQTIAFTGSSELKGSSIALPPGALSVATEIKIEEGLSLEGESDIGLVAGSDNTSTEAGPSVVIRPSDLLDADAPMTISIPLSSTALNLIEEGFLSVIYKVQKATDKSFYFGVIPTSELEKASDKVSFKTRHFGAFQAFYFKEEIKETKEVQSSTPVLVKNTSNPLVGKWLSSCREESHDNGSYSMRMSVNFSEKNLSFIAKVYTSADCTASSAIFEERGVGSYSISESSSSEEGVKNIDLKFGGESRVYLSQLEVDSMNSRAECGYTDWAVGVSYPRDRCQESGSGNGDASSEKDSEFCPESGDHEVEYSSIKIVGERMYVADKTTKDNCATDGSTVEKRQVIFDDSRYFEKKK